MVLGLSQTVAPDPHFWAVALCQALYWVLGILGKHTAVASQASRGKATLGPRDPPRRDALCSTWSCSPDWAPVLMELLIKR